MSLLGIVLSWHPMPMTMIVILQLRSGIPHFIFLSAYRAPECTDEVSSSIV